MKHRLEVGAFTSKWEGQRAISEMFSWSRRLNTQDLVGQGEGEI